VKPGLVVIIIVDYLDWDTGVRRTADLKGGTPGASGWFHG